MMRVRSLVLFFFFNDTATTEIYTLSLHDALPISAEQPDRLLQRARSADGVRIAPGVADCGAALAARLATRGRGGLSLWRARGARADVLAWGCRCRDRGGRALDCDRAASAGEHGRSSDRARADA